MWTEAPLQSRLLRIDAGRSPDLPDMPAGPGEWGVLKVSAVHSSGFRPKENKSVTSAALADERYEVRPGDLLFSRANTPELVGSACIAVPTAERLLLSDKTLRLVVDPALADARFVNICLAGRDVRQQIEVASSGSSRSMQNISQRSVESLRLRWPSVEEQRRIVDVLEAVTEAERAAEAAREKLRKVRTGMLTAAMQSVTTVHPAPGWVRMPLKEVVPSVEYGISEALNQDSRGVPTLRMNNLRDGLPELSDLRYCPTPVRAKFLLQPGDVLFNRTNSIDHVGRSGIWNGELPEATFASYLVRLNPDTSRLTPEYLVEWLLHPVVRQRVKSIATVAVQQVNVNPSRLRELSIDLPENLDAQRRLTAGLAACDRRIAQENDELSKLRTLKQGLADDLLSGSRRGDGAVA